jgi:hypothetical protein
MWWKSAKLWVAVVSEIVSIVLLILPAAGVVPATVELVATVAGMGLQMLALILGAVWGQEVGVKSAEAKFRP